MHERIQVILHDGFLLLPFLLFALFITVSQAAASPATRAAAALAAQKKGKAPAGYEGRGGAGGEGGEVASSDVDANGKGYGDEKDSSARSVVFGRRWCGGGR